MQVAWYGVRCWLMTSPDGQTRVIGTRPTHSWVWEMWTVDKRDGTTVQVPQKLRMKYKGYNWSIAFDREYVDGDDLTIPEVALFRIEYPDGQQPPLEDVDYIIHLDTEAKWNNAMNQYPTLRYRFLDQPYYPATP